MRKEGNRREGTLGRDGSQNHFAGRGKTFKFTFEVNLKILSYNGTVEVKKRLWSARQTHSQMSRSS